MNRRISPGLLVFEFMQNIVYFGREGNFIPCSAKSNQNQVKSKKLTVQIKERRNTKERFSGGLTITQTTQLRTALGKNDP